MALMSLQRLRRERFQGAGGIADAVPPPVAQIVKVITVPSAVSFASLCIKRDEK